MRGPAVVPLFRELNRVVSGRPLSSIPSWLFLGGAWENPLAQSAEVGRLDFVFENTIGETITR